MNQLTVKQYICLNLKLSIHLRFLRQRSGYMIA